MAEAERKSKKAQMAHALAKGMSVAAWARAHDVPKRTAYRWSKDPKIRKAVEAYRRRSIDRAVSQLANRASWVVGKITTLAGTAVSESVRLKALRGMLSDMMAVSKHSGLEFRMTEIEEQLAERARTPVSARRYRSPSTTQLMPAIGESASMPDRS
jgi:Homeodomain-like domain